MLFRSVDGRFGQGRTQSVAPRPRGAGRIPREKWNLRLTKLHDKSRGRRKDASHQDSPVELAALIETFVAKCRRPAVWEDGDSPIELQGGCYAIEVRSGRLTVEAWEEKRSFSRRILTCAERKPGTLICQVQRFGRPPGKLTFTDLDRPSASARVHASQRYTFAERFRLMLSRQFPGWAIEQLSSALDLQRSFSSLYPRALLTRGLQTIAALACSSFEDESGLLTSALLWFDYLSRRAPKGSNQILALFLPEGSGCLTAQRLHWLHGTPQNARLFLFNEHGSAGEVDPADLGNLQTQILHSANGESFARRPSNQKDGKREAHLEMAVRRHLEAIDPTLRPAEAHDQVLTVLGRDRTIMDLLTVDSHGRLCVIELKTKEHIQLPIQALDYWMRVRFHAARGELNRLFTVPVTPALEPRIVLLAPATAFHSTNTAVLRYFSPDIDVQRIGVNSDWNRRLTVVMRLRGSEIPVSHETDSHGNPRSDPYS